MTVDELWALPRTKAEAKSLGFTRYYPVAACKRGHVSDRWLSGACVVCYRFKLARIVDQLPTKRLVARSKPNAEIIQRKRRASKLWMELNYERYRTNIRNNQINNPDVDRLIARMLRLPVSVVPDAVLRLKRAQVQLGRTIRSM